MPYCPRVAAEMADERRARRADALEAAEIEIAERFERYPDVDVALDHLDYGSGPSTRELMEYVIAQAKSGDAWSKYFMRRVADKVAQHADVQAWIDREIRESA